ncbi:hypothetical protein JOE25_000903 [Serratia sp. PL17]|nr:hypothetical protein [Serratia sp. PL17]
MGLFALGVFFVLALFCGGVLLFAWLMLKVISD